MKIKILQDGLYNDSNHRAVECKAGDILNSATAYAESLIVDGLAEAVKEDPETIEEKPKRKKKDKTPQSRPSSVTNPFAG